VAEGREGVTFKRVLPGGLIQHLEGGGVEGGKLKMALWKRCLDGLKRRKKAWKEGKESSRVFKHGTTKGNRES